MTNEYISFLEYHISMVTNDIVFWNNSLKENLDEKSKIFIQNKIQKAQGYVNGLKDCIQFYNILNKEHKQWCHIPKSI